MPSTFASNKNKNMKVLQIMMAFLLCLPLIGQDKIKSFDFKKGEVMDVIFMRQKAGTEEKGKRYLETAVPFAMKLGYTPQSGFVISETPIEGNYHPSAMILGKWSSIADRSNASLALEREFPDFHEQRREIWANFDMTYYELRNDLSFTVDSDQYNVATAYWFKPNEVSSSFAKKLYQKIASKGGKLLVNLAYGESPYNYHHDPDLLIISSWKNKKAFEAFKAAEDKISHETIVQVNQFRIQ